LSQIANVSRAADAARDTSNLLLDLTNISKRFPGLTALEGIDFDLRHGEVARPCDPLSGFP
jgi:ribose transport system ATP-binding protein